MKMKMKMKMININQKMNVNNKTSLCDVVDIRLELFIFFDILSIVYFLSIYKSYKIEKIVSTSTYI